VKAIGAWLVRGVPVVSAATAAAFRILFMTLVLLYLRLHPARLIDSPANDSSYAATVVHWLTNTPAIATRLDLILVVTGVAVIVGAATRITYALFVAAFLGWACLESAYTSHHPISTLSMLVLGLLPARWSDAWSVDAWIRRRMGRAERPPSPAYGYAVWLPGFVLGVAFAAAAWSKVGDGPAWIANGTIRYHFVTDVRDALVTWGPRLTSIPGVAVAGSLAAVTVEALVIVVAFLEGWRVRAVLGAAAMSLLAGFALFQGVIWPGWWLLLLGFLPWGLSARGQRPVATGNRASLVQTLVIVAIAVQQVVITVRHVEIKPLFSTYDMYSTTYDSPAEYEAKSNMVYRAVGVTAGGVHIPLDECGMSDNEAVALVEAWRQGPPDRARLGLLQPCVTPERALVQVLLEGDKRVFDWERGEFYWKRGLSTLGPLELTGLE
jgi:hypothetical protein